eukprot:gnl/Hemi2/6744_TR2297_c0_g2_i1.p1 gnl/Hemi2/6744_TR2297_c0_g2~~gnl/Hemi2/6744_TR2297_c0_g2_i1.p1  ORF type:complete len:723 (-),score=205.99 gnl/Hemi2/6744_TR2297_c0_g2_i1:76-2244(-)
MQTAASPQTTTSNRKKYLLYTGLATLFVLTVAFFFFFSNVASSLQGYFHPPRPDKPDIFPSRSGSAQAMTVLFQPTHIGASISSGAGNSVQFIYTAGGSASTCLVFSSVQGFMPTSSPTGVFINCGGTTTTTIISADSFSISLGAFYTPAVGCVLKYRNGFGSASTLTALSATVTVFSDDCVTASSDTMTLTYVNDASGYPTTLLTNPTGSILTLKYVNPVAFASGDNITIAFPMFTAPWAVVDASMAFSGSCPGFQLNWWSVVTRVYFTATTSIPKATTIQCSFTGVTLPAGTSSTSIPITVQTAAVLALDAYQDTDYDTATLSLGGCSAASFRLTGSQNSTARSWKFGLNTGTSTPTTLAVTLPTGFVLSAAALQTAGVCTLSAGTFTASGTNPSVTGQTATFTVSGLSASQTVTMTCTGGLTTPPAAQTYGPVVVGAGSGSTTPCQGSINYSPPNQLIVPAPAAGTMISASTGSVGSGNTTALSAEGAMVKFYATFAMTSGDTLTVAFANPTTVAGATLDFSNVALSALFSTTTGATTSDASSADAVKTTTTSTVTLTITLNSARCSSCISAGDLVVLTFSGVAISSNGSSILATSTGATITATDSAGDVDTQSVTTYVQTPSSSSSSSGLTQGQLAAVIVCSVLGGAALITLLIFLVLRFSKEQVADPAAAAAATSKSGHEISVAAYDYEGKCDAYYYNGPDVGLEYSDPFGVPPVSV